MRSSSSYLLGSKALQMSLEFLMGRQSCSLSTGSNGFQNLRPFSSLVSNVSQFHISDQQAAASLSRKVSQALSRVSHHLSFLKDVQKLRPLGIASASFHNGNLDNFGQVGRRFGFVNREEPWMKESSFFWPSFYSSGAAPDVSFDGSPRDVQDQQLENSTGSSDQNKPSERTLKLLSGSCYLPHPDKEETGGEDAHFICDEQAIGVADGVGGWADLGVDAGQYARELMSHSLVAIQEEPKGSIDPVRVLEKAYMSTKAKGSSTACIIALTDKGIRAVNLGDSGFIVVRDGCTIFRSPVQQHDFNFTYQLESGNSSDLPSAAQVFTVPVESGYVVVAGTDGLFDNLYNNEITAVVVHAVRAGLEPQVTAQKIAALARQRALDKNRQTPFSSAAQDAGYRYYGGKLDDITVVVSYITAFGT
ncbi:probable protein phosphatase 2C 55 [Ananas comosus]|uniref:Protein phosphatase n=1 Tax=Ananas comosus TaxID=4615 RepID=A0A6P5FWK9_ANACO|nr:probable protein phosphatase 2C 55 [Ananas comosus]XP_020097402.1 probable protein phosphatase 2C 55 [Ananas comosus]XP_020097410.1 probable protein phosphatase 2C 55 [Ananas comosus]